MATNVLKKIQIGNPLINLGLLKLYDEHELIKTDEELVKFYHRILSATDGQAVATSLIYSMISFSSGIDFNPITLLMDDHED